MAAALVVPVALSVALLPLRDHVDDVLVAVVLLAVSAAVLARAEWPPRIVAGVSAALSFNYFYAQPYDQFGGGVQGVETTVVLAVAIPVLAAWAGRLSGQEAAREKALREQAERNAAELAERQRQVERLAADLTASRRRIVAAGDEMRRRIERNLHDGVQQRLVTVSLRLGGVRDRVPAGLPAIRDDLGRLTDVLTETLDELRDLARGVHPAILVEAGLGSALDGLARRSALPVRLDVQVDGRLPAECEATAYYVVSEAFANAVKHASASAVEIQVEAVEGILTVQVSDDGVGGADSRGSGLRRSAAPWPCTVRPVPARSSPPACHRETRSADERLPASRQAGIRGGWGSGLGARPDATRLLARHRRGETACQQRRTSCTGRPRRRDHHRRDRATRPSTTMTRYMNGGCGS
jgi:signal transduction histidine kinase